jgi:hypothetical protein
MSDIPQLLAAIDGRLADLAAEITVLEAAKAALDGPRSDGRVPAGASVTAATASRPRPTRRRHTPPPAASAPASAADTPAPVLAARDDGSPRTAKRAARRLAAQAAPSRRGGEVVRAETLERLLADTSAGLSATAIAEQAGAGYNPTLKLLRELEAAGRVRRSGSRRTTVWRLITDEERIADRAAELERRRSLPSQRRGRARAS